MIYIFIFSVLALCIVLYKPVRFELLETWFEARAHPPRQTNPNTSDYFTDEVFPLVADRELGVWNRSNHHFDKKTRVGSKVLETPVWFDHIGARVGAAGDRTPAKVGLIAVGESNTWGQGLPYESTYPAVLGRSLGITAANFGLIASSGVQDLGVVRRFISLRPEVVVYGFWEEHFNSNVKRCPNIDSPVCLVRPIVRRGLLGSYSVSRPFGVNRALRDYRRWYAETMPGQPPSLWRDLHWTVRARIHRKLANRGITRQTAPWPELAKRPQWSNILGASMFVLTQMKQLADSVGARLVVVYLPFYFDKIISPPPGEIVAHAKETGIDFLSMDRTWSQRKNEGLEFVIPGEGHLNAAGHADVANAVKALLG